MAERLAYYKAAYGSGVLAPRGWYCLETAGSSGGDLVVLPEPKWGGITGPAVLLHATDGGGSGMYEVAKVIARVFPAYRGFVQGVIASEVEPASAYPFGPYPKDKLTVQRKRLVKYRTPPHSEGLGTVSQLKANDDPIDGVAILQGPTPDLVMLNVRLPRELRDLAPMIFHDLLLRQGSDAR